MAEQIITLGVGGEPENLTPFITTGLEVGAAIVVADAPDCRTFNVPGEDRTFDAECE